MAGGVLRSVFLGGAGFCFGRGGGEMEQAELWQRKYQEVVDFKKPIIANRQNTA